MKESQKTTRINWLLLSLKHMLLQKTYSLQFEPTLRDRSTLVRTLKILWYLCWDNLFVCWIWMMIFRSEGCRSEYPQNFTFSLRREKPKEIWRHHEHNIEPPLTFSSKCVEERCLEFVPLQAIPAWHKIHCLQTWSRDERILSASNGHYQDR